MSDSNSIREKSRNLDELEKQYADRKAQIIDSGEEELNEIRQKYRARAAAESDHGAAAVNHIRESNSKRLEGVREQGSGALEELRKTMEKAYEAQKESQDAQAKKLVEESKKYDDSIRQERVQKALLLDKVRAESGDKTKDIVRKRDEKLAEYQRLMQADHQAHVSRVKAVQKENTEAVERERAQLNKSVADMKGKNHGAVKAEQEEALAKAKFLEKESRKQQQSQRDAQIKTLEGQKQEFATEFKRLETENEKQIREQNERHAQTKAILLKAQTDEINQKKTAHEERLLESDKTREQTFTKRTEENQQIMAAARADFKKRLEAEKATTESTILNQRVQLLKALNSQRHELMDSALPYGTLKQDPFYRIHDIGSRLDDFNGYYLLSTNIPEHEKDNIHVRVQKDHVTVAGARSYEDAVENTDGKKVESHSSQTFREDFPLVHPVNEKGIVKEFQNGQLLVYLPKIGRSGSKV